VGTFFLLSGLLLLVAGGACVLYILFDAAMNPSWGRSVMWLLTGAGFVYYILFEMDSQYKWLVSGGAVAGLGLGSKLFMMGAGINL
jgi:hypothetical protein